MFIQNLIVALYIKPELFARAKIGRLRAEYYALMKEIKVMKNMYDAILIVGDLNTKDLAWAKVDCKNLTYVLPETSRNLVSIVIFSQFIKIYCASRSGFFHNTIS